MAQLKDLLVNGDARVIGTLLVDKRSGGHFLTPIHFQDTSLPQKTLEYICGIDSFASGGQMGWQSKGDFLSGVQSDINDIRATYLPLSGGTMSGVIKMNKTGNPYYNLYDGTNNWYFQSVQGDGKVGIGASWTYSLKVDTVGNASIVAGLNVGGAITASGNITGNYLTGTWLRTTASTEKTDTQQIACLSDGWVYYIKPPYLAQLLMSNGLDDRYVNATGDSMTGTLSWAGNITSINLRSGHATYDGIISYQTSGNEAMMFTTKNAVTSFMFVNGEDTVTNMAANRWQSLTPGLQIKENKVSIGGLIANGASAPRRFNVYGDSYFSARIYANEWIEFANATGLYFPNHNGLHILPNTASTYGGLRVQGVRGGYHGILCGTDNTGMVVMSSEPHQGLYNESTGKWIIYYHRTANTIGIGTSGNASGYPITLGGASYIQGRLVVAGNGSSYNEGIRILPASNGWSNIFFSANTTDNGNHAGGWLIGRRGAAGSSSGAVGDFTIEENSSNGVNVTIHKSQGGMSLFGPLYMKSGQIRPRINGGSWYNPVITPNDTGIWYDASGATSSTYWSMMALKFPNTTFSIGGERAGNVFGIYSYANTRTSNGTDGALYVDGNTHYFHCSTRLYGAVWNDYAEYRDQEEEVKPGYCVASTDSGKTYKTTERLQACDGIVSDTYGFGIGETEKCKTPLAVAGRVLAYCDGSRYDYHFGDAVAAGPEGKVVKMTREEIKEYPDRIIGHVSEIPEYETWGTENVLVDGRIWIKVK